MKMMIAIFIFTLNAYAMAPTSELGTTDLYEAQRGLSSNDLISNDQEFEYVKVEDDLGIIFRFKNSPTADNQWKVYPSGFPIVNVKSELACEKSYASAIKSRMESLLIQSEDVELFELRKFNDGHQLKAWISVDKKQLNQMINLKLIQGCGTTTRKVSSQN